MSGMDRVRGVRMCGPLECEGVCAGGDSVGHQWEFERGQVSGLRIGN